MTSDRGDLLLALFKVLVHGAAHVGIAGGALNRVISGLPIPVEPT